MAVFCLLGFMAVFCFFDLLKEAGRFKDICKSHGLLVCETGEADIAGSLVPAGLARSRAGAAIVTEAEAKGAVSVAFLRGGEGLRLLEDVLASSQTLQGLADLLADLLGLGRSASGGQASGDALREVNIQGASPFVMDTSERTIACGANHY